MIETSIYEYINTKNISIKEINFEDEINNKIFYTKFNNMLFFQNYGV